MKIIKKLLYVFTVPVILFIFWWFLSANNTSPYFPSLQSILAAFPETWFKGGLSSRIVVDGFASIGRLTTGYVLAALVAIALGAAIGLNTKVRAFCEPTLELFRAIPGPVLVPIISLFMGIGDSMKIAVVLLGCLWPILLNTIEGVRSVDSVMVDTAKSYRFTSFGTILRVVIPGASPQIFAGLRQGLSVGIILMVISEMFAATNGLGFSIIQFQRNFALPEMWTGIIVLGLLGLAASQVLQLVEGRTLAWYQGMRDSARNS
ncbi:ABC transporter permease [Paeniglutamicibacter cryotolerans]